MIILAVVAALLGVLLAALLAADRVAVSHAQERLAARIADRGFAGPPRVSITGFPFLTQLAAGRMTKVVVSATGRKLGLAEVKRLDVTLHEVRVNSSGAAAARLSGTALIGFAGLAGFAGTPGLTISASGPDEVRITVGLGPVTGTATARVSRAGPGGIRLAVISAGGIPVAALGSLRDLTLPLPGLPPGVTIREVSVTGQGVLVHLAGRNVSFGA